MPINKKALYLLLVVVAGFLVFNVFQKLPEIAEDPMPWLKGFIIFCAVFTISMIALRFLRIMKSNSSINDTPPQ